MKKINSIGYGEKILGVGLAFLVILPMVLFILSMIFDLKEYLFLPIEISIIIGSLILLLLIILLTVELKQDRRINTFYRTNKNTKIKISDEYYECQNCGNQRVKKEDKICYICGKIMLEELKVDRPWK